MDNEKKREIIPKYKKEKKYNQINSKSLKRNIHQNHLKLYTISTNPLTYPS